MASQSDKHIDDKHEELSEQAKHDAEQYSFVYNTIMKACADAQISINAALGIGIDVIVSCALNSTEGDFKMAGKVMKEQIMPDILEIAERLERGDYEVVKPIDIVTKQILDKFSTKDRKAN